MYAVLTRPDYFKTFEDVIKSLDGEILYSKIDDQIDLLTEMDIISRLGIKCIIIDFESSAKTSDFSKAVKKLRILKKDVRIIVWAPNQKPGNMELSRVVRAGVYDILSPETVGQEIDAFPEVSRVLKMPMAYASAVKWDTDEMASAESKQKQTPKQSEAAAKVKVVNKIEYLTLGATEIAVLGIESNVGATHTSIMMACTLAPQYKVALIEMNQTKAFSEIKKVMNDPSSEAFFSNEGVDFYWNINYTKFISEHKDQYDFIVLDYGNYQALNDLEDFIRASKRLVVGYAIDWKIRKLMHFYHSTKKYDANANWFYMIPYLSEKELRAVKSQIENKVVSVPFNENPFDPSCEVKNSLNAVVGISGESQTKKSLFSFLRK